MSPNLRALVTAIQTGKVKDIHHVLFNVRLAPPPSTPKNQYEALAAHFFTRLVYALDRHLPIDADEWAIAQDFFYETHPELKPTTEKESTP